MGKKKGWDNAFTATDLHGLVRDSPSYAGALSFMRRKYTHDLAGVDVAVTGIPLDMATSNRPGALWTARHTCSYPGNQLGAALALGF